MTMIPPLYDPDRMKEQYPEETVGRFVRASFWLGVAALVIAYKLLQKGK